MTNSSKTNRKEFIDLHTIGIGYLNRVREVPVRGGQSYMACTIAALRGSREKPERTYIDVNVCGAEADRVIRKAEEAVNAGAKVFLGFRIGDISLSKFEYKGGPKKGQQGATVKGRLLFVQFVTIDGVRIYDAPRQENAEGATETSPQDSQEPAAVVDQAGSSAEQAAAA